MARAADRPARPQVRLQILLQDPTGLNEQAAIDRLVRHLIRLVIRVSALQPAGNLLGRPVPLEPGGNKLPQPPMRRQLTPLGAQSPIPGLLVRRRGTVPPLRCSSRLTVDGARLSLAAIERSDAPTAAPREISSRSDKLSARLERRRGTGRMPPCGRRCAKIDDEVLPNTRPISFRPSPRCQRSQISALSDALKYRRRCLTIAHLSPSKVKRCVDHMNPRSIVLKKSEALILLRGMDRMESARPAS